MTIQIIFLIFIAFAVLRVIKRWRDDAITWREFLSWLFFWLAAAAVIAWPESLNRLADLIGVGRGVDVVVYASVAILFYLVFRIFVRLEKIDREVTKVVREVAIKSSKKKP